MRISDWSSDVCSSDLAEVLGDGRVVGARGGLVGEVGAVAVGVAGVGAQVGLGVLRGGGVGHAVPFVGSSIAAHGAAESDGVDTRSVSIPSVPARSEEHTSDLQSLMRISYAVFCLKKKKQTTHPIPHKQ